MVIPPTAVLMGFSTAGKSHYLREIQQNKKNDFDFFDSDKWISASQGGHVYNIFLKLGRESALRYIETAENDFLKFVTENQGKPQLIAAGPFLHIRQNWNRFNQERKPLIIYLERTAPKIYESLMDRQENQKINLDQSNPNFGSWDLDVTTKLLGDRFVALPKDEALKNVRNLLESVRSAYESLNSCSFDADKLRINKSEQAALFAQIVKHLANG